MADPSHDYKIYMVSVSPNHGENTYILAKSYRDALEKWAAWMVTDTDTKASDYLKDREPGSVTLICDSPDLILPDEWNCTPWEQ